MNSSNASAFLFDIGKVLLDFDFESSLEKLLPPGVEDSAQRLAKILEPKDSFERGDIPLDDYVEMSLSILGPSVTRESFFNHWRNIFTPNMPMWKAVEKLHKAGHRLFLFSNTNAIHTPWILENFDIFRYFEAGTYSFEVGRMKPEPEIYHAAITNHRLDPAHTLYIDDLPANIATGKEMGLRCHQYDLEDHAAFEHWLEQEMSYSV